MPSTKAQKQKILDELKEMLARQKALVLVGVAGLKVKDISELRKKLKSIGGNLKVAKKTLVELAFKDYKLEFDKKKFKEEVALAFGFTDEVNPVKTVYQFSKSNENLKILGGYLEGQFKEAKDIIEFAKLPSREEMLARLFATAQSSIFVLNNILQRNLSILKVKS